MILLVFHTAGINEKKKYNYHEKIFFGTEPGWATAQVSLRLGWALGAGRAGAGRAGTARARGARALGRQALGRQALGRQALGPAGRAGSGRHGRAERRRSRAGSGTAWRVGSWAGAHTAGRSRCADMAWTRRGARQAQAGARLGVLLHLTQFLAWFDSVFFPSHQMNTIHCEIIFFEKKNIFKKNIFKNQIKSNKF